MVAATDDKVDKATLRMAEIESLLADEMDVSATVQLERLDELERSLAELDPAQFVRRSEVGGGPAPAPAPFVPAAASAPAAAPQRPSSTAMPSTSLGAAPSAAPSATPPAGGPTASTEPSLSSF